MYTDYVKIRQYIYGESEQMVIYVKHLLKKNKQEVTMKLQSTFDFSD